MVPIALCIPKNFEMHFHHIILLHAFLVFQLATSVSFVGN